MANLTETKPQEAWTCNIIRSSRQCHQAKTEYNYRMKDKNRLAVAARNDWRCINKGSIILNNIGFNSKNNINRLPIQFYNKRIKIKLITIMEFLTRLEWEWQSEMEQLLWTLRNMAIEAARCTPHICRKLRAYKRWPNKYTASKDNVSLSMSKCTTPKI